MRTPCLQCLRPEAACFCALLPKVESRTRVIFLQHPRERRVAIGTARMAHLSLVNSELHSGVDFDNHPRLAELVASGEAALLFPGEGALGPEAFAERPLKALVVIDGTWPQARKMYKVNSLLQQLPRVGFVPRRPGNYRIRREPAAHCLSTIEAVSEVLGKLESDEPRFDAMLKGFERMVEFQMACTHDRQGPPRRRAHVTRQGPALPLELVARWEDLVLVYAESNVSPSRGPRRDGPELIHLLAIRPSSSERFQAVIKPRVELFPATSFHLGMPPSAFEKGERMEAAAVRFRAFVRSTDIWCTWGGHVFSLLKSEGLRASCVMDMRRVAANQLRRKPGSLASLGGVLGTQGVAWGRGRAGERMASLEAVVHHLRARCQPNAEGLLPKLRAQSAPNALEPNLSEVDVLPGSSGRCREGESHDALA